MPTKILSSDPRTPRRSFVVVGAGIGGLAASIALRRAGHEVRTLERADELREAGHGITLWSNAMRVLRRLDCASRVLAVASALERGELRSSDGRVLVVTPVGAVSRALGEPSVALSRTDLQEALSSALPEGAIELNSRCTAVETRGDRALVKLENGRELSADVVVGADGINSVVRAALHGASAPSYAGYSCWRALANFEHAALPAGQAFESWGPGARFGAVSIGRGRVYWFCSHNAPPGQRDDDVTHALLARFAGWHAPIRSLIEATSPAAIQRLDILERPVRQPWWRGRVVLLGDSAHAMTPNLGQGACLAIEDALTLANVFDAEANVEAALAAYERARFTRAAKLAGASRRLGWIGQLNSPLLCATRNACMRLTPSSWMRRAFEASVAFEV